MLTAAMFSSNLLANRTIDMAIGDWAPYTSETDQKGKLLEKIVTEAFKLEGINVHYDYFPWARSYGYVISGKYAGTFPWNKTQEREKEFVIHKMPLIKDEGVFFHLKSKTFDWKTIDDIKKYKAGVTVGYKQETTYKENGIVADVAPTEIANFQKLLLGRIDIFETSKIVGYDTIKKQFTPDEAKLFTHHPKAIEENAYYILFSRKSKDGKDLADKFDSGLNKLMKSGAYKKFVSEYLGSSM